MLNESIENIPVDMTAKNIAFLRRSVKLSINDLASQIEIDPISIYQFEKENYQVDFEEKGDFNYLISLANYFAIQLDVLIYTDIEKEKLLDKDWFNQLINERCNGEEANRRKFYKEVDDRFEQLKGECSRENVLRQLLCNLHRNAEGKKRYDNLRIAGLIEKIDFFEEPD